MKELNEAILKNYSPARLYAVGLNYIGQGAIIRETRNHVIFDDGFAWTNGTFRKVTRQEVALLGEMLVSYSTGDSWCTWLDIIDDVEVSTVDYSYAH